MKSLQVQGPLAGTHVIHFRSAAEPRCRSADPGLFPHKEDSGWRLKTARINDEQLRFNPILHEVSVFARRENGNVERVSARPPRNEAEYRKIANPQRPGKRKGINEFNELQHPFCQDGHQAYRVALSRGGARAFHKHQGMCALACEGMVKNHGRPKPYFEPSEMRPRIARPTTPRVRAPREPLSSRSQRPQSAGAANGQMPRRPMSARAGVQGAAGASTPRRYPSPQARNPERKATAKA